MYRVRNKAGTPTFMSPELCSGEGYSGQLADIWALGATMYMIRCGKPPFMANQVESTAVAAASFQELLLLL